MILGIILWILLVILILRFFAVSNPKNQGNKNMEKEPEVEGIESFLEKFEEFLTKEVGDKWNYEWRSDGIFDEHNGLRFTTFTVWGEQFDNQ